jgi:hypothetical protein
LPNHRRISPPLGGRVTIKLKKLRYSSKYFPIKETFLAKFSANLNFWEELAR